MQPSGVFSPIIAPMGYGTSYIGNTDATQYTSNLLASGIVGGNLQSILNSSVFPQNIGMMN